MRPISGDPEALTNTQGKKPPKINCYIYEKEKNHYQVQGVKVQTLQKMGGQWA